MRGELVGVNDRLRAEMAQRERAEVRRRELEARLRHRQRVETIGTLAGGIAHEINNALLPIMLLAESALADLPPESPARADLAAILSSARRAKEIVVKVLTFSREANDAVIEPIELAPVVREAMRLFALVAPSTVQVRMQLSDTLPKVRADAAMLVQLVINLCTNGFQAMAGGVGELAVSLQHERLDAPSTVPAGDYVVLTTTDTGHGMTAATMERIFEPFFTTREVGAGTGLGLAVAHGIVEAFNATIVVDSQLGVGSTFRVYLPVAPVCGAQPEPEVSS
jgi:signal transduction histidine kinase